MVGDKRIAIVCAHFTPQVGYQEEALARAFARLGAMVLVLTTTELSANARTLLRAEYRQGVQKVDGYTIVRVPTLARLGANVVGRKVRASIRAFSPDYVILIGPGKLFGLELFSGKQRTWRRIVVIQDNSEDGRSRARERWSGPFTEVLHRVLKRPAYRQVVRNADRIILNVPETQGLIEPWLRPPERQQLRRKGAELSLGFDPERFFFDPAIRAEWRTHHGLDENDLVLATCTPATPTKRLEDVIDTISTLRRSGVHLKYVLAGLLGDRYAAMLKKHVTAQSDSSAFVLLPTLGHDEMRTLFCASDLGFWPQAAITIQQAMGTGLPVVLRRRPTVSHLLTPGTNGWFVETEETLMEALSRATKTLSDLLPEERLARRTDTACFNSLHLSYDVIALKMLDGLLGD